MFFYVCFFGYCMRFLMFFVNEKTPFFVKCVAAGSQLSLFLLSPNCVGLGAVWIWAWVLFWHDVSHFRHGTPNHTTTGAVSEGNQPHALVRPYFFTTVHFSFFNPIFYTITCRLGVCFSCVFILYSTRQCTRSGTKLAFKKLQLQQLQLYA